jgi:hypothetical protein
MILFRSTKLINSPLFHLPILSDFGRERSEIFGLPPRILGGLTSPSMYISFNYIHLCSIAVILLPTVLKYTLYTGCVHFTCSLFRACRPHGSYVGWHVLGLINCLISLVTTTNTLDCHSSYKRIVTTLIRCPSRVIQRASWTSSKERARLDRPVSPIASPASRERC